MKKRRAVLLLALVLLAAGLVSLWNAAMFYKGPVTDESQKYSVNHFSRRAFAGPYIWDGDPDHMTIVIPEEAGGVPVTPWSGRPTISIERGNNHALLFYRQRPGGLPAAGPAL